MPTNVVKPGQEAQWEKAKKLAAQQGRAEDWRYVMGIFKRLTQTRKSIADPSFDRHTQSGRKVPLPPDDVDNASAEALGSRLAQKLGSWTRQDHDDAAAAHMLAGMMVRGEALGLSQADADPKLQLARRHLKMAQAHTVAGGQVQTSGDRADVFKAIHGAGSHGGHIVGYTRSGKVVYEPGHGHQVGYTAADHHDAAKTHIEAARKLTEAKKTAKTANMAGRLRKRALRHLDLAAAHIDAHKVLTDPTVPTVGGDDITEINSDVPVAAEEDVKTVDEKPKRAVKYIKREKINGKWVYTYPDDGKPKRPRKKKEEAVSPPPAPAPEPPAPEPAPPEAENPDRQEAKEALEEPGEYEFARDSKFGNKGEDLKLSARHKLNAWRSWEDAERKGIAKDLVKRDILMKVQPLEFMAAVEKGKPIPALVSYLALKKFPSAPNDKMSKKLGAQAADNDILADLWENEKGEQRITYRRVSGYNHTGPLGFDKHTTLSKADLSAFHRGQYVKAFTAMQAAAKAVLDRSTTGDQDPGAVLDLMRRAAGTVIETLRKTDSYSDVANSMIPYYNNILNARNARNRNTVVSELYKITKGLADKPESARPASFVEATKRIIEGDSPEKATGQGGAGKPGGKKRDEFTAAQAYTGHAIRKGPPVPGVETAKSQEKTLLDTMGMRGLQWGNSVTDSEREHHLKLTTEAFADLADVLDLPTKVVSLNNRLGLAIGARGHGNAMAHYELNMRVINLTRKNGVGSLAHEWGHFFDNICSEMVQDKKAGYLTDKAKRYAIPGAREADHPVTRAMAELYASAPMQAFRKRLGENLVTKYADTISPKKYAYWTSTIEVWARCFERHVQTKLHAAGRENTYLSGGMNQDLWPNDEESKALAPHFDKVFEAFKASGLVNKALRALWRKAS